MSADSPPPSSQDIIQIIFHYGGWFAGVVGGIVTATWHYVSYRLTTNARLDRQEELMTEVRDRQKQIIADEKARTARDDERHLVLQEDIRRIERALRNRKCLNFDDPPTE